jgi:hypothetical protein
MTQVWHFEALDDLPWPEGLTQTELWEREEEAWMTGSIAIPDLRSAVVRFELVGDEA